MNEPKDMTGVLFRNDRKEKDAHPDRKGSCLIGGVEYWVAGWLKDGKNGQFLSLAFTPKDQPRAQPTQRSNYEERQQRGAHGLTDDKPW